MHRSLSRTIVTSSLACAAACLPTPYRAGALEGQLPRDAVRRLGCIDVGFELEERPRKGQSGLLLHTFVGNHCRRSALFDLGKLSIERHSSASSEPLRLSDPRGEIEPRRVEVYARGEVVTWLEPRSAVDPASTDRICVDASRTTSERGNGGPVCFRRTEEGKWRPDPAF